MACLATGCGESRPARARTPSYTDLLTSARPVETRPATGAPDLFVVRDVSFDGKTRRALIVPVPSRVTWRLKVPAHGRLTGFLGLMADASKPPAGAGAPLVCLIGISDGRVYELLLENKLDTAPQAVRERWVPLGVDLSTYGEWKWSLFYQPSRRQWDLTVSLYGTSPAVAAFGDFAVRVEP
jgi:hypothetical protein